MAEWSDVAQQAGELAAQVQARFDAHGLGLLATLRRDGSPRIGGIEPLFAGGQLWLGMMPESTKVRDLLRDPRFELHSATNDKQVTDGDGKISGRAVEVHDADAFALHRKAFAAQTGYEPPPGPFNLFKVDVREILLLKPAGDHLTIDYWIDGQGLKHVDRY